MTVEIVKNFLRSSSFLERGSVDSTSWAWLLGFMMIMEGSYLISLTRRECMLVTRLNFVLAWGGGK